MIKLNSNISPSLTLSGDLISFTPEVEFAYEFDKVAQYFRPVRNYSQEYDSLFCNFSMVVNALSADKFMQIILSEVSTDIGLTITDDSNLSLFLPYSNLGETHFCQLINYSDSGYYDDLYSKRVYDFRVKLYDSFPVFSGDYSSYAESFVNQASVNPTTFNNGTFAFQTLANNSVYTIPQNNLFTPKFRQVELIQSNVKPYDAENVLKFFRINRTNPISFSFPDRIFGVTYGAESKQRFLSGFYCERQANGLYTIQATATQIP